MVQLYNLNTPVVCFQIYFLDYWYSWSLSQKILMGMFSRPVQIIQITGQGDTHHYTDRPTVVQYKKLRPLMTKAEIGALCTTLPTLKRSWAVFLWTDTYSITELAHLLDHPVSMETWANCTIWEGWNTAREDCKQDVFLTNMLHFVNGCY